MVNAELQPVLNNCNWFNVDVTRTCRQCKQQVDLKSKTTLVQFVSYEFRRQGVRILNHTTWRDYKFSTKYLVKRVCLQLNGYVRHGTGTWRVINTQWDRVWNFYHGFIVALLAFVLKISSRWQVRYVVKTLFSLQLTCRIKTPEPSVKTIVMVVKC